MKTRLTIAIVWSVLAGTLTFVAASSVQRGRMADAAADVIPAAAAAAAETPAPVVIPYYVRGPRIIHVPQPGDERANVNERDQPAVSDDDDDVEPPPRPRRAALPPRTTPRWPARSETPAEPRRTVLRAPSPLADGPTPVRPTPKFSAKTEPGEKFAPPRAISSSPPPPPIGYQPPASTPSAPETDAAEPESAEPTTTDK